MSFDADKLKSRLEACPSGAYKAFAAASATRLLITLRGRVLNALPFGLLDDVWLHVTQPEDSAKDWSGKLAQIMDLIPDDDQLTTLEDILKSDAMASLAYAIRCILNRDPKESVWAARRAYEAADQAAIFILRNQGELPYADEGVIESHKFVRRELWRQNEDILLLYRNALFDVMNRAFKCPLLTEEELDFINKDETISGSKI